jgi:hypothetical protein
MNYRISIVLIALVAAAAAFPVFAEDKPAENSQQSYVPSLALMMTVTQLRHFKLWYAGEVDNWDLAKYELAQIKESIQDAVRLFPTLPAADMTVMTDPVEELERAIDAGNRAKFSQAYEKLTAVCNSCHKNVGVGFIVMRIPRLSPIMTSPFSDQSFSK